MYITDPLEHALSALIFGIAGLVAVMMVRYTRPRWLGLSIGLVLVGSLMCLLLHGKAWEMGKVNRGPPRISDFAAFWPALVVMVSLCFIPTRLRERPANYCACGYNLTGNISGVCPECGCLSTSVTGDDSTRRDAC